MGNKNYNGKPHPLPIDNTTNVVAFKVYLEQLVKDNGKNYTEDEAARLTDEETAKIMVEHIQKAILKHFPKNVAFVIAIIHNRGLAAPKGSPFLPSSVKLHMHVVFKYYYDYKKRERIKRILKDLNIRFRMPQDKELLENGGCESVGMDADARYGNYIRYLTHDTGEAIHDGKEIYQVEEFFGNLTCDEIRQLIQHKGKLEAAPAVANDKNAAETYLDDLGKAYREFVAAYRKSGDLHYAKKIKKKAEEKANDDYKRTLGK